MREGYFLIFYTPFNKSDKLGVKDVHIPVLLWSITVTLLIYPIVHISRILCCHILSFTVYAYVIMIIDPMENHTSLSVTKGIHKKMETYLRGPLT